MLTTVIKLSGEGSKSKQEADVRRRDVLLPNCWNLAKQSEQMKPSGKDHSELSVLCCQCVIFSVSSYFFISPSIALPSAPHIIPWQSGEKKKSGVRQPDTQSNPFCPAQRASRGDALYSGSRTSESTRSGDVLHSPPSSFSSAFKIFIHLLSHLNFHFAFPLTLQGSSMAKKSTLKSPESIFKTFFVWFVFSWLDYDQANQHSFRKKGW